MNKEQPQVRSGFAGVNFPFDPGVAERKVDAPTHGANLGEALPQSLVEWGDNGDLGARLGQAFRHRAEHIAQPAGLRVGIHLTAGQQDLHARWKFSG
jgi:hypothetical protein